MSITPNQLVCFHVINRICNNKTTNGLAQDSRHLDVLFMVKTSLGIDGIVDRLDTTLIVSLQSNLCRTFLARNRTQLYSQCDSLSHAEAGYLFSWRLSTFHPPTSLSHRQFDTLQLVPSFQCVSSSPYAC